MLQTPPPVVLAAPVVYNTGTAVHGANTPAVGGSASIADIKVFVPHPADVCCKLACCCSNCGFFCKMPECCGLAEKSDCLCMSSGISCALGKAAACCLQESSCVVCSADKGAMDCCHLNARSGCCCLIESISVCRFGVPKTCCKGTSQCCCCVSGCALPCDDEVPFEIGCLGIMCVKAPDTRASHLGGGQQIVTTPVAVLVGTSAAPQLQPPATLHASRSPLQYPRSGNFIDGTVQQVPSAGIPNMPSQPPRASTMNPASGSTLSGNDVVSNLQQPKSQGMSQSELTAGVAQQEPHAADRASKHSSGGYFESSSGRPKI